ncbi:MAG: hypothetical protein JJLCMIEE_03384 [Acidimicrobiales bacterium]|nr:MAG: type II toxin-antitoxin system prevent-host-death family antitoxin [Actinomycetota bacterium]MBV6510253.1 hypothetical protein [Acidimicrobiales bacterium]RIK04217.1 MAG: type II toxin-antitoxin system prevent-host-death family antitoxin [Acidobacteriota bacterium]
MERVGIRELRNQVAAVVRRAKAGERIVVTLDGAPVAQLGPLEPVGRPGLDDLFAAGLATAPAVDAPAEPPLPSALPVDMRAEQLVEEVRRG